jgi:uncharacterized protein with GYD domain
VGHTHLEAAVAHYMIEVGYTPEAWSAQVDKHPNVVDRITPALDACGAKLQCIYYAFGEVDLVGIIDFKTPEDAAAFGLAVSASGALRTYRTTPLLTVDQGMDSMKKAAKIRKVYTPPLTVNLDQPVPTPR